MEYVKPKINTQNVEQIVFDKFKIEPSNLTYIQQGQIAATFSYTLNEKDYFIQFNQHNMSHGFGIEGSSLDDLSIEDFKSYIPKILMTLFNISKIDISDSKGYGWINPEANGGFETWESFLDFVYKEEPKELFYGKWFDLFETTFLEKEKYEYYYSKMKDLYTYIPTYRSLIHGNYGYGNVFVHQNEVSAIIDWQDAAYGDYLFDFSKFIFWLSEDIQAVLIKSYIELLKQNSINTENYIHRINCYKFYLGLDALRFFAKTNNKENYNFVIGKISEIG
jgi:hygromycin-B 4-O-kinase